MEIMFQPLVTKFELNWYFSISRKQTNHVVLDKHHSNK